MKEVIVIGLIIAAVIIGMGALLYLSMSQPCEYYKNTSVQHLPVRCLQEYNISQPTPS